MFKTRWNCFNAAMLSITAFLSPVLCLRAPISPADLAFLGNSPPSYHLQRNFKLNAEGFDTIDAVDREDYQEGGGDYLSEEMPRSLDMMPPTVNNVTLCGRIGFVDQPVLLGNGYKALKLAIATSERGRMGMVKTLWHKVVLYGQGNVDYVHSRARVGDRALVVGTLTYYSPQQSEGSQYRAKVAEVAVRTRGSGHSFILLPKNKQQGDDYGAPIPDDSSYNYSNV